MIELWNGKENLNKWKRRYTYNKFPVWFWKLLCFLKIKHNWLLIQWITINSVTKKEYKLNEQYGIEECVYCFKRRNK